MTRGRIEMRRGRRVPLEVPVLMRQIGPEGPGPVIREETAKNVSLTGIYFETTDPSLYALNEPVMACLSVSEDKTRDFPFTRLDGTGRVARILELAPEAAGGPKRFGVALEFGDDVLVLAAQPH